MRSSLSTAAVLIGLLTSSGSMGAPASASPNAATLAVQPARISDLMPSATVGPCTINTSNPVFQHDAGGNYYVHANGGITCPSGAFVTSGYTYLNTDDLLAGIHNITLQGSGSTTVTNILLNSYSSQPAALINGKLSAR